MRFLFCLKATKSYICKQCIFALILLVWKVLQYLAKLLSDSWIVTETSDGENCSFTHTIKEIGRRIKICSRKSQKLRGNSFYGTVSNNLVYCIRTNEAKSRDQTSNSCYLWVAFTKTSTVRIKSVLQTVRYMYCLIDGAKFKRISKEVPWQVLRARVKLMFCNIPKYAVVRIKRCEFLLIIATLMYLSI